MEKIGILGAGNILLRDEGFGVRFISILEAKYDFPENVEIIDGGTAGLFLTSKIEGLKKLLIIDVVKAKGKPGTIELYNKEDFFLERIPLKVSPHQIGLQEVLLLTDIKGTCPKQVRLIGIIPKSVEAGTSLSPELNAVIPEVERITINELEKWNIKPKLKINPKKPNIWWDKK
ncbi:MAG: hydrogenase maturation protease [Nitrospiraceae bacterium]|nr:hydrogenase maturation protease [Nitrospiraceae bacterium]